MDKEAQRKLYALKRRIGAQEHEVETRLRALDNAERRLSELQDNKAVLLEVKFSGNENVYQLELLKSKMDVDAARSHLRQDEQMLELYRRQLEGMGGGEEAR